jgi:hypothetical protein
MNGAKNWFGYNRVILRFGAIMFALIRLHQISLRPAILFSKG